MSRPKFESYESVSALGGICALIGPERRRGARGVEAGSDVREGGLNRLSNLSGP